MTPQPLSDTFDLAFVDGRLTSLKSHANGREFLAPEKHLGDIQVTYSTPGGDWVKDASTFHPTKSGEKSYSSQFGNLGLFSEFETENNKLVWKLTLTNTGPRPLEIGDLAVPLPMNTRFSKSEDISKAVLKHSFVSGDGSFLSWLPADSSQSRLLMTTLPGTSLEYWDNQNGVYRVFLHSLAQMETVKKEGGTWRLPITSRTISPSESVTYGFTLSLAKDDTDVRNQLVENGKTDVQVAPGMTVPTDLTARLALRSKKPIQSLTAEFPAQTVITKLPDANGYQQFQVKFSKLGENLLTIHDSEGRPTYLEYFVTEPLETLIKKRAAFIAGHQIKDPSKWYRGLFCEWNQETGVQLTPDNYDRITGWRIYEVTCDDPGLSKPAFLAAKNAEYPDQNEVTALDDYIQYFVWGGLQQTTKEPYPYAIYGIPDWHTLRNKKDGKPTDGVDHVWRCYDYPHIILMYQSMYRVAKNHPEIKTRLSASDYLDRAYGTTVAMFTVPDKLIKWSPYDTGYYNEIIIPNLIKDLESNGKTKEAQTLRTFWQTKVKHFVADKPNLFQSEYAFDSTGFESTGIIADYASQHQVTLGFTDSQVQNFARRQLDANLFCRGTVEPAYYLLGSDYRGGGGDRYTLSYMAPMGGGSVLDYGLRFAKPDSPESQALLRLGYTSLLSSWALMNTGTADSNYGYWFPGKQNDGGTGGGFEPASSGTTWLDQPHHRGAWYYSCETDLGYCGYLRKALCLVTDDPVFGPLCLGGESSTKDGVYQVFPKDGLRRRLSLRLKDLNLDVDLHDFQIDGVKPVFIGEKLVGIPLVPTSAADSQIILSAPVKSVVAVSLPNKPAQEITLAPNTPTLVTLEKGATQLLIRLAP